MHIVEVVFLKNICPEFNHGPSFFNAPYISHGSINSDYLGCLDLAF